MDDSQAIDRLKAGDIAGLEWLVQRYQRQAYQSAFLIVLDEQLAEDAVQDAFLQVYKYIHKFDATKPFQPWLMRCVINLALTAVKARGKYDDYPDLSTLEQIFLWHDPSPEEQIEASELQSSVWQAIEMLTPNQRVVVVMHYFLGMKSSDISAVVGNQPVTVRWLLNAARKRLRALLTVKE